jgi:hypothetical protein
LFVPKVPVLLVEPPKVFVDAPNPELPPKPVDVVELKPLEDPKLFVGLNPPDGGVPNAVAPLEDVVVEVDVAP